MWFHLLWWDLEAIWFKVWGINPAWSRHPSFTPTPFIWWAIILPTLLRCCFCYILNYAKSPYVSGYIFISPIDISNYSCAGIVYFSLLMLYNMFLYLVRLILIALPFISLLTMFIIFSQINRIISKIKQTTNKQKQEKNLMVLCYMYELT